MEQNTGWEDVRRALELFGTDDIEEIIEKLQDYESLLAERRRWAGLTSRTLGENTRKAVLESIALLSAVDRGPADVAEVGSGGGLLGIVLSLACRDWKVALVESSGRKAAFLAEAVGALGLQNARVVNARAETLAGRTEFDLCISRAAGTVAEVGKVALGLLKKGGSYVALKRSRVEEELEEAAPVIKRAGGEIEGVILPPRLSAEVTPLSISLVVVRKL